MGPGETTEELLRRGAALPIETTPDAPAAATMSDQEKLVQRYGHRCAAAGLCMIVAPVGVVAWVASTDPDMPNWAPGSTILSVAALGACMVTGGVFLAAGLIERLLRYSRTQARRAIAGQVQVAKDHAEERAALQETLDSMGHAIDMIAEVLPEHDQIVHWRGFNNAVREGFAKSTGTDGPPTRGGLRGRNVRLVPPGQ